MPVFRSGKGKAPKWCKLQNFEFIRLPAGKSKVLKRGGRSEHYIVCRGTADIEAGNVKVHLAHGGHMDLTGASPKTIEITALDVEILVFRAMGNWTTVSRSGLFQVHSGVPPRQQTPHGYTKHTNFDNHYHDSDEYWILFQGKCRIMSEGKQYDVESGDCVATGMGWHHDVVSIHGDDHVKAVWLETGLEGRKRPGHLWEPVHGRATPQFNRV